MRTFLRSGSAILTEKTVLAEAQLAKSTKEAREASVVFILELQGGILASCSFDSQAGSYLYVTEPSSQNTFEIFFRDC